MKLSQEFATPTTRSGLRLYPSEPGNIISSFHQSDKWLTLPKHVRAPMVTYGTQHFYLDEPCELQTGQTVLPQMWYAKENGSMWCDGYVANLLYPDIVKVSSQDPISFRVADLRRNGLSFKRKGFNTICEFKPLTSVSFKVLTRIPAYPIDLSEQAGEISLPVVNPLRMKSNGMPLYTVPLILNADDVSGGQSKRYNPHHIVCRTCFSAIPKSSPWSLFTAYHSECLLVL